MKKKLFIPALLMASLLFFGAGCEAPADENGEEKETTFETKDANGNEQQTEENNEESTENEEENETGLNLSAEALGDGQVKLTWTKSDSINTDAERGFVLVRSQEKDPIHDETNYWFRQSAENRETVWKYILPGKQHFRICALQNEKCAVYSNDVELEVK